MTNSEPEILENDGARCALWWRDGVPQLPGERLGVIGQYQCTGAPGGILEAACGRLAEAGCTLAVGPMDQNTWRTYRFATEDPSGRPPFFLEPTNPPAYPDQWRTAGFVPHATYRSTIATDLAASDPRATRIAQRLRDVGATVRAVDLARYASELAAIHDLSLISFQHNRLYTPLDRESFIAQYERLRPAIDPELALLAHDPEGQLVGFCFAIPDLEEARRGERVETLIVKTAAVRPGRLWAGLGVHLLEHCQTVARAKGYRNAIHALMEDGNTSRTISEAHGAQVLRRYTLFSKRLVP
ncbi:MAG: N-acetyltransferase family protein [Armatimonadota bacterium]